MEELLSLEKINETKQNEEMQSVVGGKDFLFGPVFEEADHWDLRVVLLDELHSIFFKSKLFRQCFDGSGILRKS